MNLVNDDNKLIAWNIVYELMQRSREPLSLITLHPCGGQYYCLAMLRNFDEGPLMLINISGTNINVGNNNELISYPDLYRRNKEDLLNKIARTCGYSIEEKPIRQLLVIQLFINLIEQGMDVTSAWLDSSYDNCLGSEAKNFPYYSLKDVSAPMEHWPWWVICRDGQTIAMCNIDTHELILLSGYRYNIKEVTRATDLCNNNYAEKLNEWKTVISDTQRLLKNNNEWKWRYAEYAKLISANSLTIRLIKKSFREWEPLKCYLNITNAKNAKKTVHFELRYLGQTVADLKYLGNLKLNTDKYNAKNKDYFDCMITLSNIDWVGTQAREFRNHFKNLTSNGKVTNPGNEEHRYESLLLSEMLKTKNKLLPYMKPVTIGGVRFPMPTPLKASNHKTVSYTKHYGGGIDIFARAGRGGKNTNLCIMELKDENVKSEPPKDVIKQSLIYTSFIRELLRSDSGDDWWKLFGFSSKIPEKLVLYTFCVMPSNSNNDTTFEGEKIHLGGQDVAILHYIYFMESNNELTKIDSSLIK